MSASPRLAIIGGGGAVEFGWIPALRQIGWAFSVLIEESGAPMRLDGIRDKFPVQMAKAADWQSCADGFDAALVTLPHALHGRAGVELIKAKKHVFMDAPLALNVDECNLMIDEARRDDVVLSVDLHRRRLPVACWTKALLQSEILGRIVSFEAREGIIFRSHARSDLLRQPNPTVGGVLTDTGSHTLDLLRWWLGDFDILDYQDDNAGRFEAECVLTCRLTSGTLGHIELSRIRHLRNSIRIDGTHGFLEVGLQNNNVVAGSPNVLAFRYNGTRASEIRPISYTEIIAAELNDFRTSISTGYDTSFPAADIKKTVELIERSYAGRKHLIQPWRNKSRGTSAEPDFVVPKLPPGSIVAVTGATGFIGGRLVERLVEEDGAQVRCIVRHFGRTARLARFPVEMVSIDLGNYDEVHRAVKGANYVFNCAYDVQSPQQNIVALRNLVKASRNNQVARLIHVSTFAVYEPFLDGPLTEETRNGDRSNAYVDTKLILEDIIFQASRNCGLAATVVQPAIVYGPFCLPWTNKPSEMLIRGDVILPDQGEGLCNAVYIEDVVDGLKLAATSSAAIGERFILSGPQPVTWATFFNEFSHVLGTKPPQFWSSERIGKANRGAVRDIWRGLARPKYAMRLLLEWKSLRRALQGALEALPVSLRLRLKRYYLDAFSQPETRIFIPTAQALALYNSKAVAASEKARAKLGYNPQFEFSHGMSLTADYLRWAYGDTLVARCRAYRSFRQRIRQ